MRSNTAVDVHNNIVVGQKRKRKRKTKYRVGSDSSPPTTSSRL